MGNKFIIVINWHNYSFKFNFGIQRFSPLAGLPYVLTLGWAGGLLTFKNC